MLISFIRLELAQGVTERPSSTLWDPSCQMCGTRVPAIVKDKMNESMEMILNEPIPMLRVSQDYPPTQQWCSQY